MTLRPSSNVLRDDINRGRFILTVETVVGGEDVLSDALERHEWLSQEVSSSEVIAAISVADRVHSDGDPDSLIVGAHFLESTSKQPLVHLSGKGRGIEAVDEIHQRMLHEELENVLVLTGDKLKNDYPVRGRPRYLESVIAVHEIKQRHPHAFVAVAVSPFKYREESGMAQYLKLGRKVDAGADWCIAQIGFDFDKYRELIDWVCNKGYALPVAANVMAMPARRARFIRKYKLAGVTITDDMMALLEEEERSQDKGLARSLQRLALQVTGLRLMGYRGVQLSGISSTVALRSALAEIDRCQRDYPDLETWQMAWSACWTHADGRQASPVPDASQAWYIRNGTRAVAMPAERWRYRIMDKVHTFVFDKGPVAAGFGLMVKRIARTSRSGRILERMERFIKAPLFGCETCGMCRLALTQYVCPESCPKGLANGACGGTDLNRCEFGDRECVHSVKYRIAKSANLTHALENGVVPAVPAAIRGTTSWPAHFRGEIVSLIRPVKTASYDMSREPEAADSPNPAPGIRQYSMPR